ncbi:Type I inositol polyphosphate 5-phosphatase 5 [Zea mays]|uniref:Type I inositol polyphosphate 5-phosphatase 5 n=1 Tax=Zea mays TaxID=4577 RepID=A0A1D6HKM8_MAIZE|nr:Type I inositol polyphosphate 5-phosphatase 5 [Zea mays]
MSNHNAPCDIPKPASVDEFLAKNGKKKKSFMSGLFRKKGRGADKKLLSRRDIVFDLEGRSGDRMDLLETSAAVRKSFSDRHCTTRIENLTLSCLDSPRRPNVDTREYRVFVGTWNVGGKPPDSSVNLQEFLQIEGLPDIYVLGFQEIVPLNAGNVLVVEDNEPAGKWMDLIYQALNRPPPHQDGQSSGDELSPPPSTSSSHYRSRPQGAARDPSNAAAIPKTSSGGMLCAQKPPPPLKMVSKCYRVDNALVKTCTCMSDPSTMQLRAREMREFLCRVEAAAASPGRGAGAERRRPEGRRRHELLPRREEADGRDLPVGVGAPGAGAVRRPPPGRLRRPGHHGPPREQGMHRHEHDAAPHEHLLRVLPPGVRREGRRRGAEELRRRRDPQERAVPAHLQGARPARPREDH